MSFSSQGFAPPITQALDEMGFAKLTPIQQKAMPIVKAGYDVLATAQTGTGKTAAFALPIIQKLLESNSDVGGKMVQGLILAPTRELAEQIGKNCQSFCQYTNLDVQVVFGGKKSAPQIKKLASGCDILVATPGRLLELLEQQAVVISQLKYLVFDEADRILDLGFIGAVTKIMAQVESSPQILMFSATVSSQLNALAADLLRKPKRIKVAAENSTADTINHVLYPVDQERKTELLSELIGRKNWRQVLVFVNYKETANDIVKELKLDGIKAVLCHGDKGQGARRRALEELKSGKARVMVATDVAARGLDIEELEYVINYDMPFLAEDYVHRIGRTGRAGRSGNAVSFVSRDEELSVFQVEKLIQQPIRRIELKGYKPKPREAHIEKLNAKPAFKERRSRTNNPDSDQFSAERRMALIKRIKSRK